jgi:lysophospholipase L1-like esterase
MLIISFSHCKKEIATPLVNNTPAVQVINQGVPGNTALQLLARITTVISEKPQLVIIMIGTNDAVTDRSIYHDFKSNLSEIIDSLKDNGSAVMLLTPPPIESWSKYAANNPKIDSVCAVIDTLSIVKNCYFVNVNQDLNQIITPANSHQLFSTDGLHPSAAGYADIAGYVYNYMMANTIKANIIVCFGDSITYGVFVDGAGTALGDTYPAVLQKDLN